jgi:hypothetical protein
MANARRRDSDRVTCRANHFDVCHTASLATPQSPGNRLRLKTKFASRINPVGIARSHHENIPISFFPKL